jgi:D-serine deaminase-like pyridoxal phosphate-dependent protein
MEVYNSAGSTPGAKLFAKMRGVDEIRPGAYVFYDEGQVFMGVCKRKDCALRARK